MNWKLQPRGPSIHRVLGNLALRHSLWRERLTLAELAPERLRDLGLARSDAIRESRKGISLPPRRRAWEEAQDPCPDASAAAEPIAEARVHTQPLDNTVSAPREEKPRMITCFIRYEIDPFRVADFETYARNWGRCIPRCGAELIGYFAPHEGSATTAYGVYNIEDLAAYERYRERLRLDPEGRANYQFARERGFIRREDRIFLRLASGPHAEHVLP